MKVFIGITQDLEQTREFLSREYKGQGICAESGPFRSIEEASAWEQFMQRRTQGHEPLALPRQPVSGELWYGITLEWHGS